MKTWVILLLGCLLATPVWAQNGKGKSPDKPAAAASLDDVSGMYTFLEEGEFVQITPEEQGRVSGFVSRYGDLPSDKGAFLDQFIKKGTLAGNELTFTTEPVHGVWYEFHGTVVRGAGKAPGDEAYYVLKGTLTQNTEDAEHHTVTRSRQVEFKRFPQEAMGDKPKRD